MHLESPSPSLHPSTTRSSSSCFVQTPACVSVSAPQAADSSHAASTLAHKKDFSVQGSRTAPACTEVNACSAAKHCSRTLKLMANVSQETDRQRICKKTRRIQKHAQLFWNAREFYFEINVGFIYFLAFSGQPGHLTYCKV